MSRLVQGFDGVRITVATDGQGTPVLLGQTPVLSVVAHHREWIGVLDGEPERDVWRVLIGRGVCELHYLHYPTGSAGDAELAESSDNGEWLLVRWED